ncbi:MAG TPA: LLM class flavin-dependent oxidoreductase [Acidimicrobiia bacterium]|jgi:alkanesulfonate monooxygenase SsuD/methylene tetrahydromethanopterin reductase-like flavin-dependent oxidoreductase (luciferase family)
MTAPLAAGSVSLRLYPHDDLDAPAIVDELRAQAALAIAAGFDGVMTSEHHAGFPGYLPNPLQAAGWCLDAMDGGWAAPCPMLLPLRPTPLVAEDVAWLAARFPGRVGVGVASGALASDFELVGQTSEGLATRFAAQLEELAGVLSGRAPGALRDDPAVRRLARHPVPVVSAAMGLTAARRAARLGAGLLFDSLSTPERNRELVDAYRAAGGTETCIAIRRAWVGEPPRSEVDAQIARYRSYSPSAAQARWGRDELVAEPDAGAVAEGLVETVARAGATAVNLRVHVPGVTPAQVREQIERLGADVVGPLRASLRG